MFVLLTVISLNDGEEIHDVICEPNCARSRKGGNKTYWYPITSYGAGQCHECDNVSMKHGQGVVA